MSLQGLLSMSLQGLLSMSLQGLLSMSVSVLSSPFVCAYKIDPRCEKTGLRGFRPGPTQTGLYTYRS